MKNKIEKLVEKAKRMESSKKMDIDVIENVESSLNIKLSQDFLDIAKEYHFEYLSHFDWSGMRNGVIYDTLRYRSEEGLPNDYLILADQGDAGVILMKTQDSREKPSPVIWCDLEDLYNLCAGYGFQYNPDIWPSFTDFFEFLIEKEKEFQKQMKD